MATGDMHKKLAKIGPVVLKICSRADTCTQTNTQTDKLIAILHSPTGAE